MGGGVPQLKKKKRGLVLEKGLVFNEKLVHSYQAGNWRPVGSNYKGA